LGTGREDYLIFEATELEGVQIFPLEDHFGDVGFEAITRSL
jgi:hypothetical protein